MKKNKQQQGRQNRNRDVATTPPEGAGTWTTSLRDNKVYVRRTNARGQGSVAEIFDLATRTWLPQHFTIPDSLRQEVEARYAMSHA